MYLDPSTGSLMLQVIAAGVMSTLAVTARARDAVKSFFRSMLSRRGTAKR
jgi:hypothetical protein